MVYIRYGDVEYVVTGEPSARQVRERIVQMLRLQEDPWLDVEFPDGPNVRHNTDMVVLITEGTSVAVYER